MLLTSAPRILMGYGEFLCNQDCFITILYSWYFLNISASFSLFWLFSAELFLNLQPETDLNKHQTNS